MSKESRRRFFDAGKIDAVVTDDKEALEGRKRIGDEDVQSLLQVDDQRADASTSTRWLLATSDTTGEPKLIEHTTRSLCWSVSRRFSGESVVWALCYGVMRFAGLQVLLQSLKDRRDIGNLLRKRLPRAADRIFARERCNTARHRPTSLRGDLTFRSRINYRHARSLWPGKWPTPRLCQPFTRSGPRRVSFTSMRRPKPGSASQSRMGCPVFLRPFF